LVREEFDMSLACCRNRTGIVGGANIAEALLRYSVNKEAKTVEGKSPITLINGQRPVAPDSNSYPCRTVSTVNFLFE
jgi:hypothetical protein